MADVTTLDKLTRASGGKAKGSTRAAQRERIANAAPQEIALARAAYERHKRACRSTGCLPEHFNSFLAEWLDPRNREDSVPTDAGARHTARDYGRVFEEARFFDYLA